jgi:protein-arginine kinase activator protein McsA
MRITKRIKYEDALDVDRFDKLKSRIKSAKEKNPNYPIAKLGIEEMNYFLVIETKDLSEELGFGIQTNNFAFGFFAEKEKHKKFLKHIRKKNSQPAFFKKIGLLYDVVGCYLVATTKKDKKKVSVYRSSNTISIKLDMNRLPEEIENMCNEFEEYQLQKQQEEQIRRDEVFGISQDDREKIIENIVSGILFVKKPFQEMYPNYNLNDMYETMHTGSLNIEQVIENKLDDIYDVIFLEQVMDSAIEKENFELCAKIRDRISILKEIK